MQVCFKIIMFVPRAVKFSKAQGKLNSSREEDKTNDKLTVLSETDCFQEVDSIKTPGTVGPTCSVDKHQVIQKMNTEEKNECIEDLNEEKIKEKSTEQRLPKTEEPICVVCGRYGEYICDETDNDVCSLECKQKDIEMQLVQDTKSTSFNSTISRPLTENADRNLAGMNPDEFHCFFLKNHHYEDHPVIAKLSNDKSEFLREKFDIKLQGNDIPNLILEFRHCRLQSKLEENLAANNYLTPTSIQMQAIPVGLTGRDLLACAQTGTGKSASFLLPIIDRISSTTSLMDHKSFYCEVPLALILCPTRELSIQIENQAKIFSRGLANMKTALLIGGNPLPQQLYRLKQGVQIVIATPGRLCEILEKHGNDCNLEFLQIFVLDEVDSMLQLGFQNQVDRILECIPETSQKMMFSATIPSKIEKIASRILRNPIFVSVGSPSTPSKYVKQIVLWVEDSSKKRTLFDIINGRKHFCSPAVIFVDSKLGADMLADAVNKVCNIPSASVHGEKLQSIRDQILDDFFRGTYQVLVSTSLLGRGVDLLNVKMVINFDMPSTVEEYIHQIGRAGKLDKNGFAITFINNTNKNLFLNFTEMLQNESINIPAELINSPFLKLQKERRESKSKQGTKRCKRDLVTTSNLSDLLKQYSQKRKR